MTDNVPQAPQEASGVDPDALPKHTTPTWEVELLISGVAVFSMLQLPGWLDDRYFDLVPRLDTHWAELLRIGYIYSKVGSLILAGSFVVHLLLRSQWIALVGMGSVYPRGILWENLRMGTQQRSVEIARVGDVGSAIERADNRATIVFATGVSLAVQMLKLVFLIAAAAAVSAVIGLYLPFHPGFETVLWLITAVVLPFALASTVDRLAGRRAPVNGPLSRVLRVVFLGYSRTGIGRASSVGSLLMLSNEGYRRVVATYMAITIAACSLAIYQYDQGKDPNRFGNYSLLPSIDGDAADALAPAHYDDQRGSQHFGVSPFVQSQVVTDPYLRLAIPFRPELHDVSLRRACPDAVRAMDTNAKASLRGRHDVIACLAAMHPVELDGRKLAPVHYDLGTDPKAQRPALVAMIDVRALANGRHELLVGEPVQADGTATPPDRIPFWR